ncbi:UNVERIFIED_CONTAM: hypothetical protein PYX00_001161 [Menopon gallinae]|uniref:Trichohyalin-plectin-homology domain-containing protein n=1 Tax=Menopon gallinae TaxID=328185 RepID=A0AAW2IDR6_9NEOP
MYPTEGSLVQQQETDEEQEGRRRVTEFHTNNIGRITGGGKMMKICRKIPVICHENRKAWLEKQNTMIKCNSVTPEPSLLGSSVLSHNVSLNSLSELPGEFSWRNACSKSKMSPSQILFEHFTPSLKEEDKKILRLMAQRREAAIREEEIAHSVRNMWAEEKKQHAKNLEERMKSRNEYIAQKRKMEGLKNYWRKKNQIDMLNEEKILLESRINEKHERTEWRKKEISAQKKVKPGVENYAEELIHTQRKREQDWEDDFQDLLKLKYYEDKSRRAEEKLRLVLAEKLRRIKESSLKRDLKWQAAKDLREEIRRKAEEIQKENMKREETYQAIREHRVINAIEWKKRMALEKNQMKKEYHAFIYNKLKEEEREKETQARLYLQAKEARMRAIREEKESAISRSRSNSRMAANLRQKIKSSYNF